MTSVIGSADVVRRAEGIQLARDSASAATLAPFRCVWAQNGSWWYQALPPPDGNFGRVLERIDPGGIITKSIAPQHNIGCVVFCSTEIIEPGVIRHIEGTRFTIGEPDGSLSQRCTDISAAFKAGGLRAPVEARLRDQIWLKLIGNVAFNPVTALTRATLGELGTVPKWSTCSGHCSPGALLRR